ncbi:14505_t:CDS:2 [Cetraspora pellucida]|uniref:14505_t:CDS:1 n=1 Tax=Cetraspora pellucida TaxID=1433469 RepID=A0A9N9GMB9_9GLOM|nr:14505_t:CDS:2 [Cetraspora pellucida]
MLIQDPTPSVNTIIQPTSLNSIIPTKTITSLQTHFEEQKPEACSSLFLKAYIKEKHIEQVWTMEDEDILHPKDIG